MWTFTYINHSKLTLGKEKLTNYIIESPKLPLPSECINVNNFMMKIKAPLELKNKFECIYIISIFQLFLYPNYFYNMYILIHIKFVYIYIYIDVIPKDSPFANSFMIYMIYLMSLQLVSYIYLIRMIDNYLYSKNHIFHYIYKPFYFYFVVVYGQNLQGIYIYFLLKVYIYIYIIFLSYFF